MVNSQTKFNYVYNGDFTKHTCNSTQLTAGYTCLLPTDGTNTYYWSCYYSHCAYINVETEANFMTTMTNINVGTLDRLSSGTYARRGFDQFMYPIYAGTYKFSFTAMTRKTGNPANFNFQVVVSDYGKLNYYINWKMYTFSSLGTINITETLTITNVNRNRVYIMIGAGSTASATPNGPGITNVRF